MKTILKSDKNSTLYNYEKLKQSNLGVSFITGTTND